MTVRSLLLTSAGRPVSSAAAANANIIRFITASLRSAKRSREAKTTNGQRFCFLCRNGVRILVI
jgi:hypothetical protein